MSKAKTKAGSSSETPRSRRPALSPEAREKQLISYAYDLVEQRLLDGTASSQETTHFLKLASAKYRMELEVMEQKRDLDKAKKKAIESSEEMKEVYENALEAMRRYSGNMGGHQ